MTRQAEGWMQLAACRELAGLPWLQDDARLTRVQTRTMRLVCCGCPVRDCCEEYVARAAITGGFWAGHSRELDDVDDLDGAA